MIEMVLLRMSCSSMVRKPGPAYDTLIFPLILGYLYDTYDKMN